MVQFGPRPPANSEPPTTSQVVPATKFSSPDPASSNFEPRTIFQVGPATKLSSPDPAPDQA